MKKVIVLGGGGFIGGHLAQRLKNDGCYVRICDIKRHEYFAQESICHEFILGDLRDPKVVDIVIDGEYDEVFQLAADMGGAGFVFTGENDFDIMHNSALINLNVADVVLKSEYHSKIFYSSSACMYPAYNQEDAMNPKCSEDSA